MAIGKSEAIMVASCRACFENYSTRMIPSTVDPTAEAIRAGLADTARQRVLNNATESEFLRVCMECDYKEPRVADLFRQKYG